VLCGWIVILVSGLGWWGWDFVRLLDHRSLIIEIDDRH
jgi:hypothetical protein